jgi:hypothetical protein
LKIKVYIGDEDGDIAIFKLSAEMEKLGEEINMGSIMSTRRRSVANDTMFIANRTIDCTPSSASEQKENGKERIFLPGNITHRITHQGFRESGLRLVRFKRERCQDLRRHAVPQSCILRKQESYRTV